MSGGSSPMGGGLMRQRHSHGYSSGGEDLEDDACSRGGPPPPPDLQLSRRWSEVIENMVWIVSTVFILYYGDGYSNFVVLLWHDRRIRRFEMYIGLGGILLDSVFVLVDWKLRKCGDKWDISNSSTLPIVAFIGLLSFVLLSLALWPIWSFLTLPLLFTLLITGVVIVPYIVFLTSGRPRTEILRID